MQGGSKGRLERADDVVVELLPREGLPVGLTSKVTTSGGDAVDGCCEAKVANDVSRLEGEVGIDEVSDGFVSKVAGAEGVNTNADGVGHTDGVGELDFALR